MNPDVKTTTLIYGTQAGPIITKEGRRGPFQMVQLQNYGRDGDILPPTGVFLADDFPRTGLTPGSFIALPVRVSAGREGRLWTRTLSGDELKTQDFDRVREVLAEIVADQGA